MFWLLSLLFSVCHLILMCCLRFVSSMKQPSCFGACRCLGNRRVEEICRAKWNFRTNSGCNYVWCKHGLWPPALCGRTRRWLWEDVSSDNSRVPRILQSIVLAHLASKCDRVFIPVRKWGRSSYFYIISTRDEYWEWLWGSYEFSSREWFFMSVSVLESCPPSSLRAIFPMPSLT